MAQVRALEVAERFGLVAVEPVDPMLDFWAWLAAAAWCGGMAYLWWRG